MVIVSPQLLLVFTVPSVPVNVSVCQVGITSVSVSWGVPEHPNGLIIGYMVWYAPATDRDDEMVC